MSYGEEDHSGIPTRAIHESYIEMQRALQSYRNAKDAQRQGPMANAHGELQSGVLTLYEIIRPHLKKEPALGDWWEGRLPNYPGDYQPPDPDQGRGILQVQQKRRQVELNGVNPDTLDGLKEWHEALGMNGGVRIAGIAGLGDHVLVTVQEYQKGLRHLDSWETKYTRKTKQKSGFMADKTTETVERQRIPIDRLKRAARELSDVVNELGLLSQVDAGGSEIIRGFDQSGEEPKGELDHAKYRGNPDL